MKSIIDLFDKANVLMEQNRYDDAEPILLVLIKHDAKNPEAYYLLEDVYCKQQRFEESVTMLHLSNKLLPNHPEIIHLLGWALFMNGQTEEGRAYMIKALASQPNDVRLLCDLAVLEMKAQNFSKAKEYIHTAIALEPNNDMVLEVYSVVHHMDEFQKLIPIKN